MKQLYVVLMTVILSYCDCSDVPLSCPGEHVSPFDICVVKTSENSNCTDQFKQQNFTWLNLDKETGQVKLQFNTFDSLCVGYYEFILEAFETNTEDRCKGTVFGHSYAAKNKCKVDASYHSVRKGIIEEHQGSEIYPQCEKSVNVTYNLVYRGCYRLKIKKEYNSRVQSLCSPPVFLDTNFAKENIFKSSDLMIKSAYIRKENHMEHTVTGIRDMHVPLMNLIVGVCQPEENCALCATNGVHDKWFMGLNLLGEFKCRAGKNISNCKLIGGNEIKCITENVGNRSQCVWVKLHSHPCEGKGVWKNTTIHNHNHWCQWNSRPAIMYTVIERPVLAEGDQFVTVVLASVLSTLVILCFCILLFIMRKKLGKYARVRPRSYPLVSVMPHILLLYSRDCEPFMDLMVTFRNMLRDVIKSEVYDCFDHALEEEIATGAVEWLHRLLERDDIKIVVVESECAMLRQKALFEGVTVSYWDPTWLDDIFLHALKGVANDKRSSQYDRVFVVSIRGFTDGNDRLEFITPNTRYVIPQHIEELMTNLYRQTDLEYTEHLQALERGIRSLEVYKTSNMDYMNHFLRREH